MNNNFATLCRHFEQEQITFTANPDTHLIEASFDLPNAVVHFGAHAPPDENYLTLLVFLPVRVPVERRATMGEFLHRLNQTIAVGAFDLHYDRRQVRLAMASLPDEDQVITEPTLRKWLTLGFTTADGFCPAIMKVAFGNASPRHALEQAEAQIQDYLSRHGSKGK